MSSSDREMSAPRLSAAARELRADLQLPPFAPVHVEARAQHEMTEVLRLTRQSAGGLERGGTLFRHAPALTWHAFTGPVAPAVGRPSSSRP